MNLSVDLDGEFVWSRETDGVYTSSVIGHSCQNSNARQRVIAALTDALDQAQHQLGSFEVLNAVVDVRAATTEIDRNVPFSVMRDGNSSGQHLEESAIEAMLTTGAISLKVGIVHKPHITLVAAVDNDNITSI